MLVSDYDGCRVQFSKHNWPPLIHEKKIRTPVQKMVTLMCLILIQQRRLLKQNYTENLEKVLIPAKNTGKLQLKLIDRLCVLFIFIFDV